MWKTTDGYSEGTNWRRMQGGGGTREILGKVSAIIINPIATTTTKQAHKHNKGRKCDNDVL